MEYIAHPNKSFMAKFDRFEPLWQDHTAMNILKTCDRKYFYRVVLGFAPRVNQYQTVLDWGSAYHKFREVLQNSGGDIHLATTKAMTIPIYSPSPVKKFEYLTKGLLLKAIALAYDSYEKEKDQGKIKVLAVEQIINVQMPDGSIVAGRVDQMTEWSGQIWDRDWKTTSKTQEAFAASKDPDDQATRYIYILSKLRGELIGGIMYDVMAHSASKDSVKLNTYKHIASRTPNQLEQWEREQIHINTGQLASNRKLDIWPMKEHNCSYCPYRWVCRQSSEQAQMAKLESDFVKSPWDMTHVENADDDAKLV